MTEHVLDAMRTMRHRFFLCVGSLETGSSSLGKRGGQHRWIALLVVLVEHGDMCDFRVKAQGSGLHWLYLAMALLKSLFWNAGLFSG